jgi:hypothetical protein
LMVTVDPPNSVITGGMLSGTVITQPAVSPLTVLAVIVAVPVDLAVTNPPADTVATTVLLLLQVIVLIALAGVTVAVSWHVALTFTVALSGATVTPVGVVVTVKVQLPDLLLPSVDLAVIVAVPTIIPLTSPLEFTVATAVLLLLQSNILFVALEGNMVAVKAVVSPAITLAVEGKVTLVTNIGVMVVSSSVVNFIVKACSSTP